MPEPDRTPSAAQGHHEALERAYRRYKRPVWPAEVADEMPGREGGSAGAFLALRQLARDGQAHHNGEGWLPLSREPKPGPPQIAMGADRRHA